MDLNKIKDRIAKLLAMAENNGNEHEAAQAAERARKMMDQYQLSRLDVDQTADSFGYKYSGDAYAYEPRWKNWLSVAVASLNDCQVRKIEVPSHTCSRRYKSRWEGYAEDVALCLAMYEYFCAVIETATSKDQMLRGYDRYNARVGTVFKEHMVSALGRRIRAIVRDRANSAEYATSAGTSLVVAKANQVAAQFGEVGYTTAKTKSADKMTEEEEHAARMGLAEGEKVHINALN